MAKKSAISGEYMLSVQEVEALRFIAFTIT